SERIEERPAGVGGYAQNHRLRHANSPPKLGEWLRRQENAAKPLYKRRRRGGSSFGTTPPFARKRANGTPPNLGGECVPQPAPKSASYECGDSRYHRCKACGRG